MTKAIRHQFFFAHPPEIVWEYLTKSELISQWLMDNNFLPIVGHDFQFRTRPLPNFQFDGIFYCKVLEIVPLKKLSFHWALVFHRFMVQVEFLLLTRTRSKQGV